MNREIERRWLVSKLKIPNKINRVLQIQQAYLDVPNQLRVRVTTYDDGSKCAELTSKLGKGISRIEINAEISVDAATMLIETTRDVITKTRFEIDGWELDYFHGNLKGIIMLEREYRGPETDDIVWPILPDWVHDAVEVTNTLTNRQLATIAQIVTGSQDVKDNLGRHVPKIVLTGGPCGGKSSILERLKLNSEYHVIPEVATILMQRLDINPSLGEENFQRTLYRLQKSIEAAAEKQALRDGKKAIVLDRGSLDAAAFVDGGLEKLAKILGISIENELSSYDAIILVPVIDARSYELNRHSNSVRKESWHEAKAVETKLKNVWTKNHPNWYMVGDSLSLEEKELYVREILKKVSGS